MVYGELELLEAENVLFKRRRNVYSVQELCVCLYIIMPHALPRVHSLGEKACALSMTNGSTAHTWDQQDQETSMVGQ